MDAIRNLDGRAGLLMAGRCARQPFQSILHTASPKLAGRKLVIIIASILGARKLPLARSGAADYVVCRTAQSTLPLCLVNGAQLILWGEHGSWNMDLSDPTCTLVGSLIFLAG